MKSFAKDVDEIQISEDDKSNVPVFTAIAYIFNPYSILSCVGQTTTVWSNFLLALFFCGVSKRSKLLACLALALETQRNFYPFVLLIVAIITFSNDKGKKFTVEAPVLALLYAACLSGLYYLAFQIIGSWKFVDSTLGFM